MADKLHIASILFNTSIAEKDGVVYKVDTNGRLLPLSIEELDILEAKVQEEEMSYALEQGKAIIGEYLDSKAQEYGFDNMVSARSYTGYYNKYQSIAGKLAVWSAECWDKAEQLEADIISGNIEPLTVEEIIEKLPKWEN